MQRRKVQIFKYDVDNKSFNVYDLPEDESSMGLVIEWDP